MKLLKTNLTDFFILLWIYYFQMIKNCLHQKKSSVKTFLNHHAQLKKNYCQYLNKLFLKQILLIFQFLCGYLVFK